MRSRITEQHYHQQIEMSSAPCILTDPNLPDNPVVAVNAAFLDLVGYARNEIIGRNCRFLSGEKTEEAARQELRDAVAQRRPALVEITNYKRDGTAFRNAVMIAPLFDPDGRIEFFLGSQMDVEMAQPDPRQRLARMVIATLSSRQVEVLQFMAHGLRHAEIAHRLGINEKTVKMHRAVLVKRLGCRTSAEAIRIAIEAGL